MVKASAYGVEDLCSIPGSGRSPGEGNGTPLQYSCLENPMDGGPGGLQSMGSRRVGHDWVISLSLSLSNHLHLWSNVTHEDIKAQRGKVSYFWSWDELVMKLRIHFGSLDSETHILCHPLEDATWKKGQSGRCLGKTLENAKRFFGKCGALWMA